MTQYYTHAVYIDTKMQYLAPRRGNKYDPPSPIITRAAFRKNQCCKRDMYIQSAVQQVMSLICTICDVPSYVHTTDDVHASVHTTVMYPHLCVQVMYTHLCIQPVMYTG